LDLPPKVRAVDEVPRATFAGDVRDCAAQGQVHADAALTIIEERHLGLRQRRLPADCMAGQSGQKQTTI
jgi:hypothetical protein